LNNLELNKIVNYANAVGALTTTGKGAISSLPDITMVEEFMKK